MLNETFVSTILTASITGAGLILAIYALITPLSRKIFDERVKLLREKKKEFERLKGKVSSDSSAKDFKRLKTLASEIQGTRAFPRYLSFGVLVTFSFYIVAVAISLMWFVYPEARFEYELIALILFSSATSGFFVVGGSAIVDVYQAMKGEFEKVKKEKEEVKKDSEELEKQIKKLPHEIRIQH